MKSINENKLGKQPRGVKDTLMRSFLVSSIILSILLVSNCTDDSAEIVPTQQQRVQVTRNVGGSAISKLFAAAASGAASGAANTASGWALGALGLSDDSPDYTEQLDKINESLQEIIVQLNAVQDQLTEINQQLLVLNCSAQQTALTTQTGRIDFLSVLYKSYIATAQAGGRVSNATLSNWVDQVLAEGQHTSQTPMGQILTTMANQLIQPSSGAITACVKAIEGPENNLFGDANYYNTVSQFTNYYYYYQALGLMLLNEAQHYKAWLAASEEDDDNYPADSVFFVCGNPKAALFCNKAANFTNTVYNALADQFTVAGAPYTNDYFIMQNHETDPLLWVRSLEEFTLAAGDNCNSPLNSSNNRCGITVGRYNEGNDAIANEEYRGYIHWQFANTDELNTLLAGWASGQAGDYLENTLGFKHMKSKIVLGSSTITFSLPNTGNNQTAVVFFDGNISKEQIDNKLFDNKKAFELITPNSKRTAQGSCYPFASTFYTFLGGNHGTNAGWYNANGTVEWCGGNALYGGVKWNTNPGWFASNGGNSSRQFRLPLTQVKNFDCTENRAKKNAGGVWTMCGEDFTYWFENNVPRPETCDISGVGVTCSSV